MTARHGDIVTSRRPSQRSIRLRRICFFVLFSALGAFAPASAQWITPAPQGNRIISSAAAGSRVFLLGQSSAFLWSGDTGDHWEQVTPYSGSYERGWYADDKTQHLAFADSLHGFITSTSLPYETTDGGRHWFRSAAPSGYGPIVFASARHGWMSGYSGTYRTTNGGGSWIPMPALTDSDNYLNGFSAIDSLRVWLYTSHRGTQSSGVIKASTDGGSSWHAQAVDWGAAQDPARTFSVVDVKVRATGLGLACGYTRVGNQYPPNGFLLRTTDFGATWNFLYNTADIYNTILSPADSIWVLLGNNSYSPERGVAFEPSILRSTDFGLYWTSVFHGLDLPAPATGVWIPSQGAMIAGGYYGVVYRSMDLGLTWEIIGTRTPRVWDVALMPGTDVGIAAGDSSSILRTTDRGSTWRTGRFGELGPKRFRAAAAKGGVLWIGGEGGLLLRSTDQGVHWEKVLLPYDTVRYHAYNIEDISAFDGTHVAVCLVGLHWVADASFIFTSDDGGTTWNRWEFPPGTQAQCVHMHSATGLAAGGLYWPPEGSSADGFVAQSTDFGVHWTTSHLDAPVVTVASVSDSVCLAGTYGNAWRTLDGGGAWMTLFGGNDMVSHITIDEAGFGWLFRQYDAYRSTDGGRNWALAAALGLPSDERVRSAATDVAGALFYVDEQGAFLSHGASAIAGTENPVLDISVPPVAVPLTFSLSQNFPNPFNPSTAFRYTLAEQGRVRIDIVNVLGEKVATLVDETLPAGRFTAEWNGAGRPSGTYFCILRSGGRTEARKLLLLR